jgi:hypothetical protein
MANGGTSAPTSARNAPSEYSQTTNQSYPSSNGYAQPAYAQTQSYSQPSAYSQPQYSQPQSYQQPQAYSQPAASNYASNYGASQYYEEDDVIAQMDQRIASIEQQLSDPALPATKQVHSIYNLFL